VCYFWESFPIASFEKRRHPKYGPLVHQILFHSSPLKQVMTLLNTIKRNQREFVIKRRLGILTRLFHLAPPEHKILFIFYFRCECLLFHSRAIARDVCSAFFDVVSSTGKGGSI
jgi:hypothetical protein